MQLSTFHNIKHWEVCLQCIHARHNTCVACPQSLLLFCLFAVGAASTRWDVCATCFASNPASLGDWHCLHCGGERRSLCSPFAVQQSLRYGIAELAMSANQNVTANSAAPECKCPLFCLLHTASVPPAGMPPAYSRMSSCWLLSASLARGCMQLCRLAWSASGCWQQHSRC